MLSSPRPRIAIYARHSTSMQNAMSSHDQAASCDKLVDYLGGTVVMTCLDPEQSGYKRHRPGLMRLLAAVANGEIDIIVSEALDRLARDGEDVAFLGKKLSYHRVQLHTVSEGHVDEIKFAVAALLGSIFLKHLIDKTLRGMQAAVLAGRFAGGRAYGYARVNRADSNGEPLRGILEIEPTQAETVRRIFTSFASGKSSIHIAKELNAEGIPSPRGGQWNASTIRGDPKKLVGILNNPLYAGQLVWGRRQWRRNPDSEMRERRYRLRDKSEWDEVSVPDLRIVSDALWTTVQNEFARRSRPRDAKSPAGKPRAKHLLSGIIKCGICGSNFTISGKDYYRCAGEKERGSCGNRLSVRKGALEKATLDVLKQGLLTQEHAELFVKEFNREMTRLSAHADYRFVKLESRMHKIEGELENLMQNLLAGLASPTLQRMISEREAEKTRLMGELAMQPTVTTAAILPHPALLQRFADKVADLQAALDDGSLRKEAASTVAQLIESVTIHPSGPDGPEAEIVARVEDLVGYATNEDSRPGGIRGGCSMAVVAGVGFEPTTFRL